MTQKEFIIKALEYSGIDFHHFAATDTCYPKMAFVVCIKATCINEKEQELELYFDNDGKYLNLDVDSHYLCHID